MHDLVIRNANLVDGTGAPCRIADIGIDGTVINAVGSGVEAGKREIDAKGLLVTPGFVDIHTHYDGQATWDPELSPSSWHGVTTVVCGNCGVGFAPARPDKHEWLIQLMEGVEDIPGSALADGIDWQWETFPQFLDALEQMPRTMDIACQVPHGPVRAYVMGERGARNEEATPEDLVAMAEIVKEGIDAGALGFSTSRTKLHRALDGEVVPGTFASDQEMVALGEAVADAGGGVVEVVSDIGTGGMRGDFSGDMELMRQIANQYDLTVLYSLHQSDPTPEDWRELLAMSSAPISGSGKVIAQVSGRPIGLLLGLETSLHPFLKHPSYMAIAHLSLAERVSEMCKPEVRAKILAEETTFTGRFTEDIVHGFHKMYLLGEEPNYEPDASDCIKARAKRENKSPYEYAYDLLICNNGKNLLFFPLFEFSYQTLDPIFERLKHEGTILGLGDGGAHCRLICDSSLPTFMLTHWTRDRTNGQKLSIEEVIKLQTLDTATIYGLSDRGSIQVGKKADINIIDYDRLSIDAPKMIYDLPTDAPRLVQKPHGYKATVVSGQVVRENGEFTGVRPGVVIRGRR